MADPGGVILWRGHSRLDGGPIVVIATLSTKNGKTGGMVQTWILRSDISPITALHMGLSDSVCGDCPLQGKLINESFSTHPLGASGNRTRRVGRACYLRLEQAPLSVWWCFKQGGYPAYKPNVHAHLFKGRKIRFGSYGEPTAAPLRVWLALLPYVAGWTGYTHQWRRFPSYNRICHASTHSLDESAKARAKGWRVFQTGGGRGSLQMCASSRGVKCNDCCACSGLSGRDRYFHPHGDKTTLINFARATNPSRN